MLQIYNKEQKKFRIAVEKKHPKIVLSIRTYYVLRVIYLLHQRRLSFTNHGKLIGLGPIFLLIYENDSLKINEKILIVQSYNWSVTFFLSNLKAKPSHRRVLHLPAFQWVTNK